MQSAVDNFRKRTDRHLAAAAHPVQQGALAGGGCAGRCVIQKSDMLAYPSIILPNLDRQRALSGGWTHQIRRQHLPYAFPLAQAIQPGSGQDHGIVFAGLQFAQARVHISAQRMNLEIRPQRLQLRLPPQAAGPDPSPVRQFFDTVVFRETENVSRIFTRR